MNIETLCIDSTQCETPQDSCDVTTFIKQYTNDLPSNTFRRFIRTPDNQILATGLNANNIFGLPYPVVLSKLRKDGSIIWTQQYTGPVNHGVISLTNTSDNNHLLLCQGAASTNSSGFYLLKVSPSGATVWKKDFLGNLPNMAVVELIEGSDNNFYVAGMKILATGQGEIWLTKISTAGNVVWSKVYLRTATTFTLTPYDIVDDGSFIYLAGVYVIQPNISYGLVTRISKSDGSVVWMKRYDAAGENISFRQAYKSGSDLILNVQCNAGSNQLIRINSSGAIIKSRRFAAAGQLSVGLTPVRQHLTASGEIVSMGVFQDVPNTYHLAVYKIDSAWNPVWARKYHIKSPFDATGIFTTNGNIFAGLTVSINNFGRPTMVKLTADGELIGCPMDTIALTVSTPTINVTDLNFASIENFTFNSDVISAPMSASQLQMGPVICAGAISCNMLELIGPDTVCNSLDTVTFSTRRDSTCTGRVRWAVDTAFVKVVSQTDSTIKVIFKRAGSVKLVASMIMPCDTLRDSITITIMQPKDSLNLGPDKLLCKISTLTLNTGSGFKTYRWQDGASDSTYTVSIPGTYSVEATDSCGNILRDTVIIAQAPDVPFDLGSDLAKCNNDTLTITAPAGFTKYTWADNYNISGRYTQTVKVWPSADTTYTVTAETTNGCLVYDSVRVTVKAAPPLDLGADTTFCRNDSVTISAASGFNSYLWNTGETSQQIVVKNKGLYHVSAQSPNGCITRDSLEVLNVYALPLVDLGRDTIICMNSNYTFNAGNFASYLWQDGSVARTFTASAIGKYWVQVTNANGCVSSDTAEIIRYKNCYNSIDFPNAFTPNNDRRHETYKPVVRGNITSYKFTIFNRWGQRVFETAQINYAWDGTIAGKPQDTGTFVWICEYQFAGEEKKVAKGTVLLIR
jgi:gliding motility-associated-like protein